LAAEIGATPVSVVDAGQAGEIVILAIPTRAVADLPRGLFANVPSSVSSSMSATTIPSFAMAASMQSTGAAWNTGLLPGS
jgi:predicted dinucleotide-binding enzyme